MDTQQQAILSEVMADIFYGEDITTDQIFQKIIPAFPSVAEVGNILIASDDLSGIYDFLPAQWRPQSDEQQVLYSNLLVCVRDAITEHRPVRDFIADLATVHPLIGDFDVAIKKALYENDRQALLMLIPQSKRLVANLAITMIRKTHTSVE